MAVGPLWQGLRADHKRTRTHWPRRPNKTEDVVNVELAPSQKEKKLFILGATGFIGFAVTRRLVDLGFKNIHCLYRKERKKDKLFQGMDASGITFLCGDVSQLDLLRKGVEGADIVVNASGLVTDWANRREVCLRGQA